MYEILAKLMEEQGVTPYKVAKETDVTQATLSRWKAGKVSPSIETLQTLATYFNVSTDYLLGKTSVKNPTDLFAFWGAGSDPFFEHAFDFGAILKEEREKKGHSLKEMSEHLGTTELQLEECEEGLLPLTYDWAERMANFLGTDVSQLLFEHELYDEAVPEQYRRDVRSWEKLTKDAEEEAMAEMYSNKKPATQKGDELSEAEIEIIKLYRAASEERKAIVRGIVGIE